MLLLHLLCFLTFSSILSRCETCTNDNCLLPSCQCPTSNGNPTALDVIDLPQLVLLTFIGNLNRNTFDPIRLILNSSHQNPNKCPISSTFFIHDVHTDYCLVQRLFDNQHEIAMTTLSNKCPLTNCYNENNWRRWTDHDWKEEIKQQRMHLVKYAQIHQSHIKGFRAPHLQIDQNKHLEFLRQFNFHYDSSMLFKSSNLIWPFTLNYLYNQADCINCDPWTKPFEALWEFPLHEWTYPNATTSCRTLSDPACLPADKSHSADLLFDFLMHNFERHLENRSPFVIQLDLSWLSKHKNQHLKALIRFIQNILNNPTYRYVYFVSMEKALEWLKYPRSLDELRDFWAFSCSDKTDEYDTDCSNPESYETKQEEISNLKTLKSDNKTNTSASTPIDRQGEKLFQSGIVLHAIWISILLLLSVLFYEKYFTTN